MIGAGIPPVLPSGTGEGGIVEVLVALGAIVAVFVVAVAVGTRLTRQRRRGAVSTPTAAAAEQRKAA